MGLKLNNAVLLRVCNELARILKGKWANVNKINSLAMILVAHVNVLINNASPAIHGELDFFFEFIDQQSNKLRATTRGLILVGMDQISDSVYQSVNKKWDTLYEPSKSTARRRAS